MSYSREPSPSERYYEDPIVAYLCAPDVADRMLTLPGVELSRPLYVLPELEPGTFRAATESEVLKLTSASTISVRPPPRHDNR